MLVVLAHPNDDSFNHAVAETARRSLIAAGHTVDLLDLYALGVRAAMSTGERTAYHGDQPVLDPLIAEHIALVRSVEALVFVYPTWWSALPAILKGWLERVMVPGVGFVFDDSGKVRPGLKHVRRIVGISTYGSPRLYVRAINDNGRRTLTRALRLICGLRTRCRWLGLYAIDTATAAERTTFLKRVERRMRSL
ncbi:MAG: NAD(P)H-dependent oxidoreductase [Actinobacteria bacterium]|nr:NAD(P)H-dependent oxidoreductase [Actinomycetota bacterium]